MQSTRPRQSFALAAGVLALLIAATVVVVIAGGGNPRIVKVPQQTDCHLPQLEGSLVQVGLTDASMGRAAGMPNPSATMGMTISPATVPAGAVSFQVKNAGGVLHEMLVFPLSPGQVAGHRGVGITGTVDESGSLGEVETGCGTGPGSGIDPGATGWLTLTLKPGRYELLCNFAGHYQMGMYGVLTVS